MVNEVSVADAVLSKTAITGKVLQPAGGGFEEYPTRVIVIG